MPRCLGCQYSCATQRARSGVNLSFAHCNSLPLKIPYPGPRTSSIDARETSYSIITLNKVQEIHRDSRVFFIVGIDAFMEIRTWRAYRDVLARCRFIVISRPGYRLDEARRALPGDYADSILELPEAGPLDPATAGGYRIFLVAIDALDISSTAVRRLARAGRPLTGLVPEAVDFYIRKKKLYQE